MHNIKQDLEFSRNILKDRIKYKIFIKSYKTKTNLLKNILLLKDKTDSSI